MGRGAESRATIFALSSGRPPAGVAVIRISGPDAFGACERLAGRLPPPRHAALRALRHPSTGELLDRALVLRFNAPASATGEDVVEIHCHGGRAVADALLAALATLDGLRSAEPGEFTRRAFDNGRIDLTEAEGLADLLAAETETQRRSAMALAGGELRRRIEAWQQRLLRLAARAEAAIDYDDELDPRSAGELERDIEELARDIGAWLGRPSAELLRRGIRVVAAGPPNAGKSSLINAIARDVKAIVTPIAGTTRDAIEVPLALEGIPLLLVDTAGLRPSDDVVEAIGVARAEAEIERADILLWLGDPGQAPGHPQRLLVHSKLDVRREVPAEYDVAVSALTGEGIAALEQQIIARASRLIPGEDSVALNRRQQELLAECTSALRQSSSDPVLLAESLRLARDALNRLTGRAGVEEMLDQLFAQFCLGK